MLAPNSLKYILPEITLGFILLILQPIQIFIFDLLFSVILIGIGLFMFWFFRDPNRLVKVDSNKILAAADGVIIYIEEKNNSFKIATRMSPFDVHINRTPIKGQITELKHSPGTHRSVYFAGAEDKNERNLIVVENDNLRCEILQLTGSFARRIEVWSTLNDEIEQGQKIGMIRFGSQTNVEIKSRNEKKGLLLHVEKGNSVRAGITVLASFME